MTATTTPVSRHIPPPQQRTTVNPPASTLPGPLSLPPNDPMTGKFTHFFRLGKAYLAFFKTGFRAIYDNYKETRPIQALADTHGGTLTHLVERSLITRRQFQHLMRSRHDLVRLPAFGLIFLVCGELSPFVIPFIPSFVPYPCRIPQQLSRQRRKAMEQRARAFRTLGFPGPESVYLNDVMRKDLNQLNTKELAHVAVILGVHSWLRLPVLERWRVGRRLEYLALDDTLLARGGGVQALDGGEELMMTAQERGIDTFQKREEEVRDLLERYMYMVSGSRVVKAGYWLGKLEDWPRERA